MGWGLLGRPQLSRPMMAWVDNERREMVSMSLDKSDGIPSLEDDPS